MTGSVSISTYINSVSNQTGTLDGSALKINGVVIGAAIDTDDLSSDTTAVTSLKSESSIAIAAAINKSTDLTGVTAVAQPNIIVGSNYLPSSSGPGTIYLNGVTINNSLGGNSTRADVVNVLNAYTGQTGVVATDNGKGLTLTAADGRNISIAFANAQTVSPYALGVNYKNVYVASIDALHATTTYSQVALQSSKQFTVQSGSSGDTNLLALGFNVGTFGGASNGLKVAAIDVSTQTGAQNAITAIDAALVIVSANQSRAGALINRLNDVVVNQISMQSNMTASRSAVEDTDYSTETTNLAKSQIISQAATAMLAQANQSSQNVLALLK
jgi:flagellin